MRLPASVQMIWSRPGPTPISTIGTPRKSLDEVEVVARVLRQVVEGARAGDVLGPAGELAVLGLGLVQDRLVVGELVERAPSGPR